MLVIVLVFIVAEAVLVVEFVRLFSSRWIARISRKRRCDGWWWS
ncbi:hypothetical protein ABZW10_14330 [Kitasatospora sp. NPDC004723]